MAAVQAPRALVVGTGYAGGRHAAALRDLGITVIGPVSAREVVRDPAPIAQADVVHVCSTNELHAPLVRAALDARKDVVCEKPLALDVAEAEALAADARRSGRLAVLAYNYRFHPVVVALCERVRSGQVGAVHDVRGGFLQDWLLRASDDNWRLDAARGGASRAIADIGAHWFDLAEVAVGRHIDAVVAVVGQLHRRATEDHASLLVRFAGGLAGTCVVSQAAAGHRNDLELSIDGATGSITWRYERGDELWIGTRDGERVVTRAELRPATRGATSGSSDANEPRRNLLAAVYARLRGEQVGGVALPQFDDGVRHLRIAAAALESARARAWVSVA